MVFTTNVETKIGFDKIRLLLVNNCLSPLGTKKVDAITVSTNHEWILEQLNLTNEFVKILVNEEDFPIDSYFDIHESLSKIATEGTFIEVQELFKLRCSLHTIGKIVTFFNQKEECDFFYLKNLSREIDTFPAIVKSIDHILDKFGEIKDNASPELQNIRRNIEEEKSSISRAIQKILHHAKSEGYVDQDVNPTVRDGRLVIPVPPAHKRKIRGIVHDESATGKTVFIEPDVAVEINNRIRELLADEKREIIKILTLITNEIRPYSDQLTEAFDFLGTIDFIRAKALLAVETNSTLPSIQELPIIDWSVAIHPILYLNHLKIGKEVVPLDIKLCNEKRILIISGPNAGGKSVCLKTVGLLQFMMQAGLLVPMHSSSRMGIFHAILIDIGDEQSIENDLSTYSSHLTNMKYFVRNCDNRSLLLIDEFGSGTEPNIGGAIAESLLNHFNQKKAFGVITTHYTNIKNFAEENEGIINGAMLYDRHLMQPLFRLEIGNPGSSFAIEIARKIGLPESVIAEATEKAGKDLVDMDKYLQDIVRDKRYWEAKRQNIRQKEKRLEEITEKYEQELTLLAKEKKEAMKEAKRESKRLLEQANSAIENTIRKIKEAQAEKIQTKEVRKEFEQFKENFDSEEMDDTAFNKRIERLRKLKKGKEKTSGKEEKESIKIGSTVRVKGQGGYGQVIEIKKDNVVIALGQFKLPAKLNQLEIVSNNKIKKENRNKNSYIVSSTIEDIRERNLNFKREIDVRGMRGDEALQAVTYFIDDAIIVNVEQVRILHGTGTGILRELIRKYLKTIPAVSSFADEHIQFGGAGITVVKFKC
ncbi:MAG: Smr/MutS family protein [Paludibacteraceae bacterium]|nr:Smr/MutS family protein [Paludibacteraceae bacterium]